MDEADLLGVDEALAVKAHGLVLQDLRLKALLVVQVGKYGVKALDARGTGGQDHLPTGSQHVHPVPGGAGLEALAQVAPGDGHAEHPLRGGADLVGIENAPGTLQGGHEEGAALLHAELHFGRFHGGLHGLHILDALTLGDADAVRPAGHAHPHVLLPVGGVQAVDAHDDLRVPIVHRLQGVVQGEACGVLLVLRHRVLQVQHDGVAAVDVGVLDEPRLLGVHKHHGPAQPEPLRSGTRDHRTTPPQGIFCSDAPQLRNTAHSTRAFRVQSRAPLSTTVTRASVTPRRSRVSSTVALI